MSRAIGMLLVLVSAPAALLAQPHSWSGAWSATVSGGGRTLAGTWDAVRSDDPSVALGNWAITDPSGAALVSGTWSARKDSKTWQGSWQARTASGQVYSGTWRAQSQLPPTARFVRLFEAAVSSAIQGTWQTGAAYSGAWSIRAYER